MKVAAFDVGTSKIGASLWTLEKGKPRRFVSSEQIDLEGSALAMRLSSLGKIVFAHVSKWKPRVVAIEAGFIAFKHRDRDGKEWSNPMANLTLAEARGVIRERSMAAGAVEIIDVSVRAAKRAATGDEWADKGKVQIHAKAIAGLQYLPQEDEADAIAIGLGALSVIAADPDLYFLDIVG